MTNSNLRDIEVAVSKCYKIVNDSDNSTVSELEKVMLVTGEVYWYDLENGTSSTTQPALESGQSLQMCTGKQLDSEVIKLCDVQTDGSVVEFYRVFMFVVQNGLESVTTKDVDENGTSYTVTGTVGNCVELADWTPNSGVATEEVPVTIPEGAISYSILQLTAGTPDADSIGLDGAIVTTIPAEVAEYSEGDSVTQSKLSGDILVTPNGTARAFVVWKTKA